jgi:hypothetical protein
MKYLYFVAITFLVLSCHNKTIKEKDVGFNSENSLKMKILKGDTIAYLQLRDNFIDKDYAPEFLVWALIMSNKYHYPVANYDVFFCFQEIDAYYNKKGTSNSLDMLDSTTRNFALGYLKGYGGQDSLVKILLKQYK